MTAQLYGNHLAGVLEQSSSVLHVKENSFFSYSFKTAYTLSNNI